MGAALKVSALSIYFHEQTQQVLSQMLLAISVSNESVVLDYLGFT